MLFRSVHYAWLKGCEEFISGVIWEGKERCSRLGYRCFAADRTLFLGARYRPECPVDLTAVIIGLGLNIFSICPEHKMAPTIYTLV